MNTKQPETTMKPQSEPKLQKRPVGPTDLMIGQEYLIGPKLAPMKYHGPTSDLNHIFKAADGTVWWANSEEVTQEVRLAEPQAEPAPAQKPLTAADLVVGEKYEVQVQGKWIKAEFRHYSTHDSFYLFRASISYALTEAEIEGYVRRLPQPPTHAITSGDPPPGHKWHNPENLTPEQVEVDQGFRLCLEYEIIPEDAQLKTTDDRDIWIPSRQVGDRAEASITYRTKAALPVAVAADAHDLDDESPVTMMDEPPTVAEEVVAILRESNKRLQSELTAARAELARLSWRPATECMEGNGCVVLVLIDGTMDLIQVGSQYRYDFIKWWAYVQNPPTPQPDPAYLRWKDEVSAEQKEAALFAGWKALQEGGGV